MPCDADRVVSGGLRDAVGGTDAAACRALFVAKKLLGAPVRAFDAEAGLMGGLEAGGRGVGLPFPLPLWAATNASRRSQTCRNLRTLESWRRFLASACSSSVGWRLMCERECVTSKHCTYGDAWGD